MVYYYFENKGEACTRRCSLKRWERQFIAAVGTLRIPDDKDAFWDVCDMHYTKARLPLPPADSRRVARSFIEPACSPSMDKGPVFESSAGGTPDEVCAPKGGRSWERCVRTSILNFFATWCKGCGVYDGSWLFDKLRSEPDAVDIERL